MQTSTFPRGDRLNSDVRDPMLDTYHCDGADAPEDINARWYARRMKLHVSMQGEKFNPCKSTKVTV